MTPIRRLANSMYIDAMQLGRQIGKGEPLDEESIYRIRATIAHCEMALKGKECEPADVNFKATEKVA